MADRKITDLTALAAGSQATGDLLTIVDVSESAAADKNKKITLANFFDGTPSVTIGSSGLVSPDANADNLVIDAGDVDSGISILSATTGRIYFGDAADDEAGSIRYVHSDNSMRFETASSERLRIDSSGRVVIGGTSPLDSDKQLTLTTTSTSGGLGILSPNNGRGDIFFGDAADDNVGQIKYSHVDDSLTIRTNAADRFVIDSSGQAGIGTTSPAALCHINKTSGTTLYRASVAGNSTIGLEIVKTGATTQSWRIVDGQTVNGKLEFYDVTDSATRMCIDGSGNIGMGTSSPNHRLTLHNSGTGTFDALNITSGLTNAVGLQLGISSASNAFFWHTANGAIQFATNNAERMRITNNGITFNGDTAAANALSDYEEGTWTPTAASGASGFTVTAANCIYTKVGDLVTLHFEVYHPTSVTTASFKIGGLPYTIASNCQVTGAVMVHSVDFPTNRTMITIYGFSNEFRFYGSGSGQSWQILHGDDITTSGFILGTVSYRVA